MVLRYLVVFLCVGCLTVVSGITGFRSENGVDPLRQISYTQQGQILSDVQQHQHRFSYPTPDESIIQAQSQNAFGRQALPSTAFVPNQFFQPNPTGFQQQQQQQQQQAVLQQHQPVLQQQQPILQQQQPIIQQQQPIIQQSQSLFPPNLISNDQSFLPHQNGLPQSQQIVQTSFQPLIPGVQSGAFFPQSPQFNGHQIPQQPQPTQLAFLPTIPTQNSLGNNQLSTSTDNHIDSAAALSNPLFSTSQRAQLQSILEEQRKQDLERLKELQERQKIIQKHKEFLEKQQIKQQQKVQKLHEDFVQKQKKKQQEIYATAQPPQEISYNTQSKPRDILPQEVSLFEKALKQYDQEHPTTTVSTTTTSTTTTTSRPKSRGRVRAKPRSEAENPELYLQSNRQKVYKEIKSILQNDEDKKTGKDSSQQVSPTKLLQIQRQDLLKQLKLAIAENSQDLGDKNFTSREISLPNGQKFEVIRTSDPNLIPGATPISADSSTLSHIISQSPNQIRATKQSKVSFEDISKGVLPPDTDFEVIKQSGNGKLEEVGKIPSNLSNQKKVTFVFIEEQGDGSFKVKGVRGNNDEAKDPSQDIDGILKKIKDGDIRLPSKKKTERVVTTRAPYRSTQPKATTYTRQHSTTYARPTAASNTASIYDDFEATKINTAVTTAAPQYYNSATPSSLSINHNGSPQPTSGLIYDSTTPSSQAQYMTTLDRVSPSSIFYSKTPTTSVNGHQMYPTSTVQYSQSTETTYQVPEQTDVYSHTTSTYQNTNDPISIVSSPSTYYPNPNLLPRSTTPRTAPDTAGTQLTFTSASPGLVEILKENGLFATAKYLKQSGLDAILNETGPYTVFAPTDKAFRTLLIQLGGPDKAEEKFKENPRLLSGLLLHHVIPGAFEITSLQDEMTGVSLAGTQLRVNQYNMHDVEWNEIKVTTVNGARVISDKQDINIPQGIAHAVDRVMFPLPVGDIVQTLQADRERRFTNFLKALFASELIETLSDSRTYTVFAPTDRAFSHMKSDELQKLVTEKESARALVMRHITPGTLFSAGMRYYQVRESMEAEKPITLQKNAGRIKVNSGHVVTHNIPATNGVIHAIDTLL